MEKLTQLEDLAKAAGITSARAGRGDRLYFRNGNLLVSAFCDREGVTIHVSLSIDYGADGTSHCHSAVYRTARGALQWTTHALKLDG